jgi:hypothetical protein
LRPAVDFGGDQHCFVPGEDCLAKGDGGSAQVLRSDGVGSFDTVWLEGKGLGDLAKSIAK